MSSIQILSRPPWVYKSETIDAWLYHGYFLNLRHHLTTYAGTYYGTRLAWILLGAVIHKLFEPAAANLALRFFLYWSSLTSVFFLVRRSYGSRCALVCGLLLCSDPYFLAAIGSDYVDGAGISYALIGLEELSAAMASSNPRMRLLRGFFSGAALAAAIHSNFFLLVLAPPLLLFLVGRNARAFLPISGAILTGGAFLSACLGLIDYWLGGPFLFFLPSLGASVGFMKVNPFYESPAKWLKAADWLVIPAALSGGCFVAAAKWLRDAHNDPDRRMRFVDVGCFVLLVAIFVGLNARGSGVLQLNFYASYLVVFMLVACASMIGSSLESWRRREFSLFIAALVILATLVGTHPEGWLRAAIATRYEVLKTTPRLPVPELALILFFALSAALLARWRWAKLAVLGLAIPSVFLRLTDQAITGPGSGYERSVYEDVDRTLRELLKEVDGGPLWFWFRVNHGSMHYSFIASTYLYEPGSVGMNLPEMNDFRFDRLKAGDYIALLENNGKTLAEAREALTRSGMKYHDVRRISAHVDDDSYPVWLLRVEDFEAPAKVYFPPPDTRLLEKGTLLDLPAHDAPQEWQHNVYGKPTPIPGDTPEGVFPMTDRRDHCATVFQKLDAFGEVDAIEIDIAAPPRDKHYGSMQLAVQDQDYNTLYTSGTMKSGESRTVIGIPAGVRSVRIECPVNAEGFIRIPAHITLRALKKAD